MGVGQRDVEHVGPAAAGARSAGRRRAGRLRPPSTARGRARGGPSATKHSGDSALLDAARPPGARRPAASRPAATSAASDVAKPPTRRSPTSPAAYASRSARRSSICAKQRVAVGRAARARRREAHAAPVGLQQRLADLALQRGELLGHRRRRQMQRVGGRRDRAAVGELAQRAQAAQVDHVATAYVLHRECPLALRTRRATMRRMPAATSCSPSLSPSSGA